MKDDTIEYHWEPTAKYWTNKYQTKSKWSIIQSVTMFQPHTMFKPKWMNVTWMEILLLLLLHFGSVRGIKANQTKENIWNDFEYPNV